MLITKWAKCANDPPSETLSEANLINTCQLLREKLEKQAKALVAMYNIIPIHKFPTTTHSTLATYLRHRIDKQENFVSCMCIIQARVATFFSTVSPDDGWEQQRDLPRVPCWDTLYAPAEDQGRDGGAQIVPKLERHIYSQVCTTFDPQSMAEVIDPILVKCLSILTTPKRSWKNKAALLPGHIDL